MSVLMVNVEQEAMRYGRSLLCLFTSYRFFSSEGSGVYRAASLEVGRAGGTVVSIGQ